MVSLCEWGFGETIITQLIHQCNHLYIFQSQQPSQVPKHE